MTDRALTAEEIDGLYSAALDHPCICGTDEISCRHCNAWGRAYHELKRALTAAPSPGEPGTVRELIVQCIRAAYYAMDDSEEQRDGTAVIDADNYLKLCDALAALASSLPSEPGYVESPANNVDYALRSLTAEREAAERIIRGNGDLYQLLTNIQNGITSPADASMANGIIRRIDKLQKHQPECLSNATGQSGDCDCQLSKRN